MCCGNVMFRAAKVHISYERMWFRLCFTHACCYYYLCFSTNISFRLERSDCQTVFYFCHYLHWNAILGNITPRTRGAAWWGISVRSQCSVEASKYLAFCARKYVLFPSLIKFYFRLNKMEINQGFKLCCKRCCSYTLPHLSKSGVTLTKVFILYALLLLGCSTREVGAMHYLIFHCCPEYLSSFYRWASCSSWKVSRICNTGSGCCSEILSVIYIY
jgi:hypothetical protein